MVLLKCKMCGGDLLTTQGSTICECEYCGSKQAVPRTLSEEKANLFNRANQLRMNAEFDKAASVYESLLALFPSEAEAYWGACLCDYGIDYVDDPVTGERKPTCHRTLSTSILENSNFKQACQYADMDALGFYTLQAKKIDAIQCRIHTAVNKENPTDVFICYKETDERGERTEDSVLAQDIYEAIVGKGYHVFFSRISLEDKLGEEYEPYIYAALSTAKVMLVIGTHSDFFDAVWVKNEWKRFLQMNYHDHTKLLIPCYKYITPNEMPKEFRMLQAQSMDKLGWLQDLVRGVERVIGPAQRSNHSTHVDANIAMETNTTPCSDIDKALQKGYVYLKEERWVSAQKNFEIVVHLDPQCAPAYIGMLLSDYQLTNEAALKNETREFDKTIYWQKAIHCATSEQLNRYASYLHKPVQHQSLSTQTPVQQHSTALLHPASPASVEAEQKSPKKAGFGTFILRLLGAQLCGFYALTLFGAFNNPIILLGVIVVAICSFRLAKNHNASKILIAILLSMLSFLIIGVTTSMITEAGIGAYGIYTFTLLLSHKKQ